MLDGVGKKNYSDFTIYSSRQQNGFYKTRKFYLHNISIITIFYIEIHYLQYEVPHLHDQQMNESAHVKTSTIFHKKGRTGPCQRLDPSVSVELEAADGGLERILSWQRGGWRAGETEGERGAAG